MDITPPRDDIGTEALKRTNEHREVRETDRVAPSRAIAHSHEWHGQREGQGAGGHRGNPEAEEPTRPEVERRSGLDRRRQERRSGKEADVVLDTRDHRERRVSLRRKEDRERAGQEAWTPRRGIDTEV